MQAFLLAMFLYLSFELALPSPVEIIHFFFPIEVWFVLCDGDIWPAPYHSALGLAY